MKPVSGVSSGMVAVAALLVGAPLAAGARESISNQLSLGMCRRSFLGPDVDVCTRDGTGTANASAGSGHDHSHHHHTSGGRVWSHTKPCYDNTTDGTSFCVFTSTFFADNHGITILTSPRRAAKMEQLTAFVHPESVRGVNRDVVSEAEHGHNSALPPLSYRVEAMPGKGYGVVATRPLQRGERIMGTTASVMVDYALFDSVPEADVHRLQAEAVASLPALHRSRLMNLSTHDAVEGHHATVAKILATNAFDVDAEEGEYHGFFVVFPEISRLNHDCRPNADYHFDADTLTHHIHAVRPIAAGEEITVSYIDLIQSRKQRVKKLKSTWGFECNCPLCTQDRALAKASDYRIAQILELRREFQDYSAASRATPEMAELLVSLYEQERLDAMLYEAYSYAAMEWNGVGEPWMATKYAQLAVELGLVSVGEHDADVSEMAELAVDPWSHWSWMLRKSRRMQWGKRDGTKEKGRKAKEAEAAQEVRDEEEEDAASEI